MYKYLIPLILLPTTVWGDCSSYDRTSFVTEALITKTEIQSRNITKMDDEFGKCIVSAVYTIGDKDVDITSSFPFDLKRDSEQKACDQAISRGKAEAVRTLAPGKLSNTQVLVCGDSPKTAPGIYREVDDRNVKNLPWKQW